MKQIESKRQIPFLATTISVTDPSKLINHYSLAKTATEFQRSMYKYGLHGIFTVVNPHDNDGPNAGQLKSDNNGITAINLFERYNSVTVDEVVQSCRWYQGFGTNDSCFEEDMEYSLAYFEKNTEPALICMPVSMVICYNIIKKHMEVHYSSNYCVRRPPLQKSQTNKLWLQLLKHTKSNPVVKEM